MNESYHKWYSQYISREYEMLVFGSMGVPFIFFPPAKERYYSAKDNGLIDSLQKLIESEAIKVYTPDSYDLQSWYNFSADPQTRIHEYKNFENLIIHDIIAFVKYETQSKKIILAGTDFGGYHALNFSLKHPDLISAVISMDGFFNIKKFIHGYYDEDCYFNNPPDYLPGLKDAWYLDNINKHIISLNCTSSSEMIPENKIMSSLLNSLEISHEFNILDGNPGWESWNFHLSDKLSHILNNL